MRLLVTPKNHVYFTIGTGTTDVIIVLGIPDVIPVPDPRSEFFHPEFRIQVKRIPDPDRASKNFGIFNPKHCFLSSGIMIRDALPGYRIRIFFLARIPESGCQKAQKAALLI